MAFKDENGKITIDEVAAQNDVQALQKIGEFLSGIKSKISTIQMQTQEFQGDTGVVISEQCTNLIKQIDKLMGETEDSVHLIKNTVAKYEQIDRDLKSMIEQHQG